MSVGAFSSMNAIARRRMAGWASWRSSMVGPVSALLTKTARAVAMSRRVALAANRGCPAGRLGVGGVAHERVGVGPLAGGLRREGSYLERAAPAELSDEQLAGFVMSPLARCAVTDIGPDEWFPVATKAKAKAARAEAACALACVQCARCVPSAWSCPCGTGALLVPAPRGRGDSGDRARRLGFSLRRRPPPCGDAGQLDPRGDAELAEDLAQVEGHRVHTDEHLVSRLLVGQPL